MPSVLSNRNYRLLWTGQGISQAGDSISFMAALFSVMEITDNNALAIAGLTACDYIPALLVGLWAGVFVDRWEYRRTMIRADIIRCMLAATLIFWAQIKFLPGIYVTLGLMAATAQFFNPSRQALIPDIVAKEDLLQANSISSSTFMLVHTLGGAVGGGLYAFIGPTACFIINSLSFVASALAIFGIRYTPAARKPEPTTLSSLTQSFKAGFQYIAANLQLTTLFISMFTVYLGFGVINILGPKYVTDVLHRPKEVFASLGIFIGLGATLSSAIFAPIAKKQNPAILYSVCLSAMGIWILAISNNTALPILAALAVAIGASNVLTNVGLSTMFQAAVSQDFRGRVFGLVSPVNTLASLISALLGAGMSKLVGLQPVFGAAGGLAVITGIFTFISLSKAAQKEAGNKQAA